MQSKLEIVAPISVGELLDKITILQIKLRHAAPDQITNCELELHRLHELVPHLPDVCHALQQHLLQVNECIWDLEDAIRRKEHVQQFDEEFVACARQIYQQNDLRAKLKKQINTLSGSLIQEEKVY